MRRGPVFHVACAVALLLSGRAAMGQGEQGNLPLELPGPATPPAQWATITVQERGLDRDDPSSLDARDAVEDEIDRALEGRTRAGTAADWRRMAEAAVARHAYAQAAECYRREAEIYRRIGDVGAAESEEAKASRYATELVLYHRRPATDADRQRLDTHQRLEPAVGCYIGAFIDRDDSLTSHVFGSQRHGDLDEFAQKVGKAHKTFFMYRRYGEPFPMEWAEEVVRHGAIPDIAWEPHGSIDEVRNDAYLQQWVQDAKALNAPVFLRFASEMNGPWVKYHGNPENYKRAFRTVYSAFRAAPKVALIWCPNTVPRQGIDAYYPGDDATDWVGVNFYSVVYLDNNKNKPGAFVQPYDLLDHVYRRYAARKPIAVGEWAATHQTSVDNQSCSEFAERKIAEFYSMLVDRYPRVKMVNWYDCNNLQHAQADRQLNNFCLTDDARVLGEYKWQVASHYFIDARASGRDPYIVTAVPLHDGDITGARSTLDAYVRAYVPRPKVYFKIDGQVVVATDHPGRHSVPLNKLTPGNHLLEVLVYDDKNQFIIGKKATVVRQ